VNRAAVDKIVNSVLYEGYMLYPYRRSALKNQHRWNFGLVYPAGMSPNQMQTEALIEANFKTLANVEVRFLQLHEEDGWQEVTERAVVLDTPGIHSFHFENISGHIEVVHTELGIGLQKIRVVIVNDTPRPAGNPLLSSLVSTHTILSSANGQFVSLLDPPARFRHAAANCRNLGTWPVLTGKSGERDMMLSSPIILYDYPQVADESPGDLFDGTEIDEILTLRILTLTDAEKEEMRQSGERERLLLERVESLTSNQLMKLHGTLRDIRSGVQKGDRVKLRPKARGDIFDVVLAGRTAIVESVEQDFENRTHVAVVIEDDPGKDLGFQRQPGHRFFFAVDEVERI
jgi:hypothetical protein